MRTTRQGRDLDTAPRLPQGCAEETKQADEAPLLMARGVDRACYRTISDLTHPSGTEGTAPLRRCQVKKLVSF